MKVGWKRAAIQWLVTSIFFGLSLAVTEAHADFRRALDKLVVQDGAGMLAEIHDAVETHNTDCFLLFISALKIDFITSKMDHSLLSSTFKGAYYASAKMHVGRLAMWETLLDTQQEDELFNMLDRYAKSADQQSKYRWLLTKLELQEIKTKRSTQVLYGWHVLDKYREDLINGLKALSTEGYSPATLALSFAYKNDENKAHFALPTLITAANQDNPYAQLMLALAYLGEKTYPSCSAILDTELERACVINEPDMGGYWLKRLLAQDRVDEQLIPLVDLYIATGDWIARSKRYGDDSEREAYYWYNKAYKFQAIGALHYESVKSRINGLKLGGLDIEVRTSSRLLAELPDLHPDSQPVITLIRNRNLTNPQRDIEAEFFNFWVDIYSDGRVNLLIGSKLAGEKNPETVYVLTKKELAEFFADIRRLKIEQSDGVFQLVHPPVVDGYSSADYHLVVKDKQRVSRYLLNIDRLDDDVPKDVKPVLGRLANIISILNKKTQFQNIMCKVSNNATYRERCEDYQHVFDKNEIQKQ